MNKKLFPSEESNIIHDPVCGMVVNPNETKHHTEYKEDEYHFCSSKCLDKFSQNPETYLGGKPPAEKMPEGTSYTCPMHPEVIQIGPGDCPMCGMSLDPMGIPTGDEGPNLELVDFTRRSVMRAALPVRPRRQ